MFFFPICLAINATICQFLDVFGLQWIFHQFVVLHQDTLPTVLATSTHGRPDGRTFVETRQLYP